MEKEENFEKLIKTIDGCQPDERYASFDYCFNYFQKFREDDKITELVNEKNLQQSCLQLGFYLASWGMYRNSFLLQKSVKIFEPLITYIASEECAVWDIGIDKCKDRENILKLFKCGEKIKKNLGEHRFKRANGISIKKIPTDTLVTKIMLGIFGNVPAFDDYFKKGMRSVGVKMKQEKNIGTFNPTTIENIFIFYSTNKSAIIKEQKKLKTIDFLTGKKSHRNYTKAKIVDMYGFIKGGGK